MSALKNIIKINTDNPYTIITALENPLTNKISLNPNIYFLVEGIIHEDNKWLILSLKKVPEQLYHILLSLKITDMEDLTFGTQTSPVLFINKFETQLRGKITVLIKPYEIFYSKNRYQILFGHKQFRKDQNMMVEPLGLLY